MKTRHYNKRIIINSITYNSGGFFCKSCFFKNTKNGHFFGHRFLFNNYFIDMESMRATKKNCNMCFLGIAQYNFFLWLLPCQKCPKNRQEYAICQKCTTWFRCRVNAFLIITSISYWSYFFKAYFLPLNNYLFQELKDKHHICSITQADLSAADSLLKLNDCVYLKKWMKNKIDF